MSEIEKFVKLPEMNGEKRLRILPRKKGEKLFVLTRLHMLWLPSSSISKNFHCHKELDEDMNWVGKCIICEKYNEFWKFADAQKVPYHYNGTHAAFMGDLRKIKPNERAYYNVIDRDNDTKPLVFSCGSSTHVKIIKSMIGDENYYALGDISNFKTGRDFVIVKQTKNGFPMYDKSHFLEPSVAGTKKQIESWKDNLNDLTQCRTLKPEQEMIDALKGMFGDWDIPEKKKFKKQKAVVRDINEPFESSFHA